MNTYQKLVALANDSRLTKQMSMLIVQRFKPEDIPLLNRWLDLAGQCQEAKIQNAKRNGHKI